MRRRRYLKIGYQNKNLLVKILNSSILFMKNIVFSPLPSFLLFFSDYISIELSFEFAIIVVVYFCLTNTVGRKKN